MRVLHINSNFPYTPLHMELISELNNLGDEHIIYSPISGEKKIIVNNNGEKIYIKKVFKKYDRFFFYKKQKKIINDISTSFDLKEVDIIHAHTLFTDGYSAYKMEKKYRLPYIITVRNTDLNIFFKKRLLLRKLGVNILLNASKIVFLSNNYREEMLEKYIPEKMKKIIEHKSVIIPNGINDYWHKNRFYGEKKIGNVLNIIYVGRINKDKNILTTVAVCKKLIQEGFDVKFNIFGDSENNKLLQKILENQFVRYSARIPRKELIKHYRSNDIFIMPSFYESFGLVYAEAMSQGLPLIYTKKQGFDEVFKDGTVGFAVEPKNVDMIVNSVKKIMQNYQNLSLNCRKNSENFNWESISKKYQDLYTEGIGNSNEKIH